MTKQEKIKEAYGDIYESLAEHIRDYDGSLPNWRGYSLDISYWYVELGFSEEDIEDVPTDCEPSRWRPKSLSGIESNNGWTKVESKDDLPKNGGLYTVINYNGSHSTFHIREDKTEEGTIIFFMQHFSHWKPIIEDLPPIY